jgi:hypothetical protein
VGSVLRLVPGHGPCPASDAGVLLKHSESSFKSRGGVGLLEARSLVIVMGADAPAAGFAIRVMEMMIIGHPDGPS